MQRPRYAPNSLAVALLLALSLPACQSTVSDTQDRPSDSTSQARTEPHESSRGRDAALVERSADAEHRESESLARPPAGRQTNPAPAEAKVALDQVMATGARLQRAGNVAPAPVAIAPPPPPYYTQPANTERYAEREDNPVQRASEQPVSTFSIDVDTGSYSNVRRMLRQGIRPPADAVRAEEFINYFDYGHPAPTSLATPFRVTTELAPAPWNGKRQLLMIGIMGYDVPKAELPPANLVFLIDTSGSMNAPDKLPLLKQSFAALASQLRAQDRVSIVVYAGSAGLVLPPTPGDRRDEILGALDRLQAGGSTHGGAGIQLAYEMGRRAFVDKGVNRVILATDGDFNVGTIDGGALETLVADQRKSGIALTTLGFGQGNYNDALAERLADVGDGTHAYIDTLDEARKVLVEEMQSTLLTIARDVKIQVEFNPALVAEYRLIGYENRLLRQEDFANDKVDAGDIGAGHEVTALYEITLVGSGVERLPALRYGGRKPGASRQRATELAHLRLRYKRPGDAASRLIETPVLRDALQAEPGDALRFAATVAAYADALRGGTNLEGWDWQAIARSAERSRGRDRWGLRGEFLELVHAARALSDGTDTRVGVVAD
ncbi:VWA domain-containing protein [Luteimonas vadosa]|uniref:VWA domain-containing protein n=1 Tax=Luteimonas vadosa TaxID=1165507 RepID=A0ABP9E7Z1_9GAMM